MTPLEKSRILIVDDSRAFVMLLEGLLRKEGYDNIVSALSAHEAFAMLGVVDAEAREAPFDLIMLDIMMPETDGIEACRRIKAQPHLRDIPVVMVTVKDEVNCLQQAFEAGAVDYIVKPFLRIEILLRVRAMLRLKQEMDRRKQREGELVAITEELTAANRTLERLSRIDELTSVGNRRYFDELLDHEWGRAMRQKSSIALILVDIDCFKRFNLTYGRQQGDECLQRVARALNDVVKRSGDFVARCDGEEFAAVLPDTDGDGARIVAETLRQAVAELAIPCSNGTNGNEVLTVSMGLAALAPQKGTTPHLLVTAADEALQEAKAKGPDQIRIMAAGLAVAASPAAQ